MTEAFRDDVMAQLLSRAEHLLGVCDEDVPSRKHVQTISGGSELSVVGASTSLQVADLERLPALLPIRRYMQILQDRLDRSEKELLVLKCKVKAVEFEKEQQRQRAIRTETENHDLTEEIQALQLLDQERADEQLSTMVPRSELVAAHRELRDTQLLLAAEQSKKHTRVLQAEFLEREIALKKQLDEELTARVKEKEHSAVQLRTAEGALTVLSRLEEESHLLCTEMTRYRAESEQAKSKAERDITTLKQELDAAMIELERRGGLEEEMQRLQAELEKWKVEEAEREVVRKKEKVIAQKQFDQQLSTMVPRSELVAAQRESKRLLAAKASEMEKMRSELIDTRTHMEREALTALSQQCTKLEEESNHLCHSVTEYRVDGQQAKTRLEKGIAALKDELRTEVERRGGLEEELQGLREEMDRRRATAGTRQERVEKEGNVEEVRKRAEELEREQKALEEEVKGLEAVLRASKAAEKKHRVEAQAAAERVEEMGREVGRMRVEMEVERKRRKEEEEENERITIQVREKANEVERMERRCEELERKAKEMEGPEKITPETVKREDSGAGARWLEESEELRTVSAAADAEENTTARKLFDEELLLNDQDQRTASSPLKSSSPPKSCSSEVSHVQQATKRVQERAQPLKRSAPPRILKESVSEPAGMARDQAGQGSETRLGQRSPSGLPQDKQEGIDQDVGGLGVATEGQMGAKVRDRGGNLRAEDGNEGGGGRVEEMLGELEQEIERLERAGKQLDAGRNEQQDQEEAQVAEVAYWRKMASASQVALAAKRAEVETLRQMLADEVRVARRGVERRELPAARAAAPPPAEKAGQRQQRPAGIGVLLERVDGEADVFVKSIAKGGAAEQDGRVQEGDEVHAVDGVEVRGMPLESQYVVRYSLEGCRSQEVLRLILGPEGSLLCLRLRRPAPRPATKILTPRRPQAAQTKAQRTEAQAKTQAGAAGAGCMWVEVSLKRRAVVMTPSFGTVELSPPRQRTPRNRILTPRGQRLSAASEMPSQAHYTSLPRKLAASPPAHRVVPPRSPPVGPHRSSASQSPALHSSASGSPDLPFFALPMTGWHTPWVAQSAPVSGGSLRSYPRASAQAPIRRASQF